MSFNDAFWKPKVPPGHTSYSFKIRNTNSVKKSNVSIDKSNKNVKNESNTKEEKPILTSSIYIPKNYTKIESDSYNKYTLDTSKTKLPVDNKRNILITSALPYVNNVPHLGNLIGCVLSADVYARFCRLRGHNAIYICGTDEYGTATERKALEAGCTPREICNKYHAIHKEIYQWFNIEFDQFGRTTNEYQKDICQHIFWKNDENSNIIPKTIEQLYCSQCNKFLADRFVTGICPKCHYDDARGDQCDNCGSLLSAIDLIQAKCEICKSKPSIKTTDHLFLDLKKLQPQLEQWVNKSSTIKDAWTNNSISITNNWIKEGLEPRCISRDLKWGTPVPKDGYQDKVFYVWFDAPIGYISITNEYTTQWKQWWYNPEQVELVQFMGKDNVPFHCVIFPSSLLGTKEQWTLLNKISTTEYLNYENGKFSKSRNTGIFGDNAKNTSIPTAVWRYYLLATRPETSDSMFLWNDLQARNNNELLKKLGNFINRCFIFTKKYFNNQIPLFNPDLLHSNDYHFINDVMQIVIEYCHELEKIHIVKGLKLFMSIAQRCNIYLQEEEPWVSIKTNPSRTAIVLYISLCSCYLLAALIKPYMPSITDKIYYMLNVSEPASLLSGDINQLTFPLDKLAINGTHQLNPIEILFHEITSKEINTYRQQFSGKIQHDIFKPYIVVGQIMECKRHTHPDRIHDTYILQIQVQPVKDQTVTSSVVASTTNDEKKLQIQKQADLVRKLKSEQADVNIIKQEVEKLLILKGIDPKEKNQKKKKKKKKKIKLL